MAEYRRVALFLDYENFHTSLQKAAVTKDNPYGFPPSLDFKQLTVYIHDTFGPIHPNDFIVVANFSHYDSQKGGLNKVATLIHVESFEARSVRSEIQPTPGKKYVIKDYADARLAFEIGRHSAINPAGLYIIGSQDKSMAAVGRALIQKEIPILFMFTNPNKAARVLTEEFDWFNFCASQKPPQHNEESIPMLKKRSKDPAETLSMIISKLRHELQSPIPTMLIEAMFGEKRGNQLLERAISQARIDVWDNSDGVRCISLREERLHDVIVQQPVRQQVVQNAQQLREVARLSAAGLTDPSSANWRRQLKSSLGLSSNESKELFIKLQKSGILTLGELDHVKINPNTILKFMNAAN